MKTATFIKNVSKRFRGRACVYKMDPPHEGNEYVVVSAVNQPEIYAHETLIFGYDIEEMCVTSWSELAGSVRNTTSHAAALKLAGYELPIDMGDGDD